MEWVAGSCRVEGRVRDACGRVLIRMGIHSQPGLVRWLLRRRGGRSAERARLGRADDIALLLGAGVPLLEIGNQ
eukprot:1431146-Alexandrium_andersonii.AAC.1